EGFLQPTSEELAQMAKACQVRFDSPPLSVPATTMPDDFAREAGVSDDERREYDRVQADFTQQMTTQLRALYTEVTGDASGAETRAPETMANELRDKVPQSVAQQAYWQLSHERAGLVPTANAGAQASAFERYLRLMQHAGDSFEQQLAANIGAERAHALRTQR